MIEENLLIEYGAVGKSVEEGETLFFEGDKAVFYYQIVEGCIKMNNFNKNGDEMIQGLFYAGESFGEPPLFGDFNYPASAEAVEKSEILCLEKHLFFKLLSDHHELSLEILRVFSKRLKYKAILLRELKGYKAEHRIMTLLNFARKEAGGKSDYRINMTRQTIADLTGLRVETTIRTIKKLEEKGKVRIQNHKIILP